MTTKQITFEQLCYQYDTWEASSDTSPGQIQIRGFLHPKSEGYWILSAESNVKSCCIGASNKKGSQILIPGEFSEVSPAKTTVLKGNLRIDPSSSYFYTLEDSIIVNEASSGNSILYIALILFGIFLYIFKLLKNRRMGDYKLIKLFQSGMPSKNDTGTSLREN